MLIAASMSLFWVLFTVDSFHPPKNLKKLAVCPLYRWGNRGTNMSWDVWEPGCNHRWSGSRPCALGFCTV